MSNCIVSNSLGHIAWSFWYANEYLHNLSTEINWKLPTDTDVIQIALTFYF